MMQWDEGLITGIEEIDNQHKQLLAMVSTLLDAINNAKGKDVITRVFKFLEYYVSVHFNTEEAYMTKYDYPDYISHKAQHEEFIVDFSLLKEVFVGLGPFPSLVTQIKERLCDWWINHIDEVDRVLGAFLKVRNLKK